MKRRSFIHLLTTGFLGGMLFRQFTHEKNGGLIEGKGKLYLSNDEGGYLIPKEELEKILRIIDEHETNKILYGDPNAIKPKGIIYATTQRGRDRI